MASKVDIAVIVLLAAGSMLWIEQGHNVVIDAPTPSELDAAAAAAAAAAVCPSNDDVPYSANCLAFLFGKDWQANAREGAAATSDPTRTAETGPLATPAACPDRDNVPYTPGCLAYLRGATTLGMRWRMSAPNMPVPGSAPAAIAAAVTPRDDRIK
jgi:hypothetical protein